MQTPVKKDEVKKPLPVVDASSFTKGAKKVTAVTDIWSGVSPNQIQSGLQSTDLEQVKTEFLLNRNITVIGFQSRQGVLKGKETTYLIIMAVLEGSTSPLVFICGGSVVRKKLEKCAEAGELPISGKIISCEGDDFNYYDFVS
jgi:hypothetical protein